MNMTRCPECNHHRKGEEYKCPKCDCFYSPLDEILAAEADEVEKRTLAGRFKATKESSSTWIAFKEEYQRLNEASPYNITLIFSVIFMFVFTMTLSVVVM
ncbi:MAG: hypothetical protein Q9M50_11425 [Methylococcales bacterium]|nr:hypothetical protein [Methylococcales bacterium]